MDRMITNSANTQDFIIRNVCKINTLYIYIYIYVFCDSDINLENYL